MNDQQTITSEITEAWAEWCTVQGIDRATDADLGRFLAAARDEVREYMGWPR